MTRNFDLRDRVENIYTPTCDNCITFLQAIDLNIYFFIGIKIDC